MTKDNAKDYLPLVQALSDGKKIQGRASNGDWIDDDEWEFVAPPQFYRIRPTPRTVPITVEELPSVCWLRCDKDDVCPQMVVYRSYDTQSVGVGDSTGIEIAPLRDLREWQFSSDLKTWHPFTKTVEE